MAEEVIIQVTTETDVAPLDELDTLVEEIRDKATIEASVEVEDTSLDEASDKATTLEDELNTIDSTVVTPEVDTSSLDEATGKAEETASSMDNITTAAAGLAATAGIEQMVTTADNINNSWNRLDLTLGSAGVSMDTVKSQVNSLSASTGRSGGVIRDYFNQMGIAGVTNTELLSSSFEALAGKSYQTGKDVGVMENALQRAVLSGGTSTMIMKNLGITTEDLGRAMGMTAEEAAKAFKEMTPEERLQAITKAMGDGKEANEMYKDSYQGLKDRADAAMAGLAGAVGQAILPIVIPALEAATQFIKMLADGFKSLPGPVQGAIGAVLGIVSIGTTLIGTLGMVGKVIGTVKTGLETIGMLGKVTSVLSSIGGAFSSLWGIIIANPIILVVVAVIALIAALIWAYQNVDWFREMVDNAWQSLVQLGQQLYGIVAGAIQWVMGLFQQFTSQLGLNTQDWIQAIIGFILFIPQLPLQLGIALANALAKALGFGDNFVQGLVSAASNAVSGFISYITQIPQMVMDEFNRTLQLVNDFINSLPDRVWEMGQAIIDALKHSLGIGSPGHMFYMFEGELKRLEDLPSDMEDGITRNVRYLGEGIVDSFNPNMNTGTLNGEIANGSYGGQVNFYFSDITVDNDDRMEKIYDYITRRLHWNNKTAGRSV